MARLKFLPQATLDDWSEHGRVELNGASLRVPAEDSTFTLIPALRFISVVEGEDKHQLVSKVKTEAYVREIGGEVVTHSCLVGETAYEIEPGFIAETDAPTAG